MLDKVRLLRLSTEICRHISGRSRLDQHLMLEIDRAIAKEQKQWDLTYMVDGSPSILDSTSYAYWYVCRLTHIISTSFYTDLSTILYHLCFFRHPGEYATALVKP
jgi:hypothetical protein